MLRRIALLIAIAAGCLAGASLASRHVVAGHDALVNLPRLVEFDDSLRNGILAPRWAPHLGSGHGEPVWVFAPPLYQVVSEIAHLAGADIIVAENVALIALLLFGGLTMFAVGQHIGGPVSGAVAAVSFFFAPYVLLQLYVRHAAAEFAALAFLPLVILGFLRTSMPMIAAGIAGVSFSHNAVLLIAFPFCLTAAIAMVRSTRAPLAGTLLGFGIGAWSWLPALVEKKYVRVDVLRSGYFVYSDHFATLRQIVWSPWGYGYSHPGPNDALSFTIGPLLIVVAAMGACAVILSREDGEGPQNATSSHLEVLRRLTRLRMTGAALVALGGVFFSTALSAFIWAHLTPLQYLAFPWRFLVLPSVALPVLAAYAAKRWPVATSVLVAGHVAMFAVHARPSHYLTTTVADYSPFRIATGVTIDTSADEYRPRWVEAQAPFSDSAFDPPIPGELIEHTPVRRAYGVFLARPLTLRMEIFYFPGWSVQIDGDEVPIHPALHTGIIEFQAPAGRHRIEARFAPTPVRAASTVITLLSLAAVVLLRRRPIKSPEAPRGWPAHPR